MSDPQKPIVAATETDNQVEKPLPVSQEPVSEAPAATTTEAPTTTASVTQAEDVAATSDALPVETGKAIKNEEKVNEAAVDTAASSDGKSGYLGYKAPGLLKGLKFSKRFCWIGDGTPVHHKHLGSYFRGEKADIAHHNAAWSGVTSKGLLFISKLEADRHSPSDIINFSEATHLEKQTPLELSFKLHTHHKHTFKAATDAERDSWFLAIEKAIEHATKLKQEVSEDNKYKELLAHFGKPSHGSGTSAIGTSHDQKDAKATNPVKTAAATEPTEAVELGDNGLPIHHATVHEKPAQPRSSSRGKRTSIFGTLKNKVDDLEAGKKLKKEDKSETKTEAKGEKTLEKTEASEASHKPAGIPEREAGAIDGPAIAARVLAAEVVEPAKHETTTTDSAPAATTEKPIVEMVDTGTSPTMPKQNKRSSIFGAISEKLRSPTTEKRESEAGLPEAGIVKSDAVTPVTTEVPKLAEPAAIESSEPIVPESAQTAEPAPTAAAEAIKPTPVVDTKHKEKKESLIGGFINKARAKSPISDKKRASPIAAKVENPVTSPAAETAPPVPTKNEVPAAAAVIEHELPKSEGIADAPVETAPADTTAVTSPGEVVADKDEKTTTPPLLATTKEKRRSSFFGAFGTAKTEEKGSGGFGSLFRRQSQVKKTTPVADLKKEESKLPITSEPAAEAAPQPVSAAEEPKVEKSGVEPKLEAEVPEDKFEDALSAATPANPTVAATA